MHEYTIFASHSPSYTLSPHPLPLIGINPIDRICSVLLRFCKRKKMKFLFVEDNDTESFLMIVPCVYVL
jgi:hypothetical protein